MKNLVHVCGKAANLAEIPATDNVALLENLSRLVRRAAIVMGVKVGEKIFYNKKTAVLSLICTPKVRQTEGVYIFMGRKKKINAKYSPEFKISVIMDMRKNHLGYMETVRKYWGEEINANNYYHRVQRWERIYLEEGEAGFYIERRGRTKKVDNPNKGRPRKKPLGKKIREDLIAENQRLKEENQYLKAEMEYLKKLNALIRAEEQKNGKNRK